MLRRVLEPIAASRYLVLHIANRRQSPVVADAYRREILRNLTRCAWFFAALTSRSIESEWVRFEVEWAVAKKPPRRRIFAVFDDCDPRKLSARLAEVRPIDCRGVESPSRLRRWIVRRRLRRVLPAATLPLGHVNPSWRAGS
jgi:hypothetical protein